MYGPFTFIKLMLTHQYIGNTKHVNLHGYIYRMVMYRAKYPRNNYNLI